MKSTPRLATIALAACAALTGCFGFLKPAPETSRYFLLTPLSAAEPPTVAPGAVGVGLGRVRLPAYLLDNLLAVRTGANEIHYLPEVLWAERLDSAMPEALAANLRALLPTAHVRLSTWRRADVAAEVYVTILQFDVDSSGRAMLVATWRILSPGGEETLKIGETRFARQGPSPTTDASGAIATLSDLMAELSRELAQALKETTPALRSAAVPEGPE